MTVLELAKAARSAAFEIASAGSGQKNDLLRGIASALREHAGEILLANRSDLLAAEENGMREVMTDRLRLTPERIGAMADALLKMAELPDPVGVVERGSTRPNGLAVILKRVPIGVVAMIYESRPNVTVDAAALSLKSGNAVLLRGGKEAIHSNIALVKIIRRALFDAGFPEDAVGLVTDTSRESAAELMGLSGYVDLLIPRGGKALIETAVREAKVPVIETGSGNCHVYIDRFADLEMGVAITENAKISRPSVCNSAETLLVHRDVAGRFLPMLYQKIGGSVALRGDRRAKEILPAIEEASEEDWYTEYLDYIMAVGVVDDVADAVAHINRCGTRHSEAIVTENVKNAEYFLSHVDAAAVYLNASTRFTDGDEFGLSAEIGISTAKLHVRGPMGLEALTTTKYVVLGSGQIRE